MSFLVKMGEYDNFKVAWNTGTTIRQDVCKESEKDDLRALTIEAATITGIKLIGCKS